MLENWFKHHFKLQAGVTFQLLVVQVKCCLNENDLLSLSLLLFFKTEIDFSRKTVLETNGSSRPPVDQNTEQKKASGEFKSVTGGFLEEVVSLISLKNSDSCSPNDDR